MPGPAGPRLLPFLFLAAMVFAAAPLAGQGAIVGTVSDSATGAPVEGVRIQALGGEGRVAAGTISNGNGHYRLGPLPAGPWTLTAARIGYAPRRGVASGLADGQTVELDLVMVARPVPQSEIIVTASRQPETSLQAPASTSVVTREQVEQQITATPIDLLAGVTGMDVASKGLAQRTYTARGSRGASAGSFLTLVDGRDQTLPSIAFNIPYLVPASSSDVDHIEVVRGPAGAIYGPNTERGVAQIITRSPFDAPGTTLSLAGGGRDLFQAELRQAGVIGARLGYKLTGEFIGGTDWVYVDTVADIKRAKALADTVKPADPDTLLIGIRNPKLGRYAVGGELQWRAGYETTLQTGVGYALAVSAVDLEPTLGPIQLLNWGFGNAEAEFSSRRVLGRVSYSWNNSGDSYSLWYGNHLIDLSSMMTAQLKASSGFAQGGSLQYGGDLRYTNPNTMGTIDGANEGDDQVTEVGAYVLGGLPLGTRVHLSAALRADYHDRIGTVAFAPRLGVVYQPTPTQALRLTYGRGYTTPAPPDFFADIQLDSTLGGLPYEVRISGIPPGGYQFRRDCGGLCMRSPFGPDSSAFVPIDAAAYWDAATDIVYQQSKGTIDIRGIPAPNAGEVGSVLRELNLVTQAFNPTSVTQASVVDYPTEKRETTDAIEVGYKAALGSRWNIGVDVAYSMTKNFFGASYVGTPNVFLAQDQLTAYLTTFVGADTAAMLAAGMTQIPLGVVTPANAADPTALLQLRHQGGSFTRLGVDLDVSYQVSNALTLSGNYSWVNRDSIGSAGGSDMAVLSAPRNKGAAAVNFRPDGSLWGVWAQGLAVETYPVKSGVFQGTIPGYAVLNAGVTVQLPRNRDLTFSLTASNVLNHVHQEYVGAPAIGRLVTARIQAVF